MLNYSKLRNIEQREKTSPHLTDVGIDFYKLAYEYVKELEEKIEEEKLKNPSSKKLLLLTDELRNTRRILESIFERREKKIILLALSAVRGGKAAPENLTREEKIFYDSLVTLLKEHRKRAFESGEKEFIIIRVLEDIPQFVGSDMKKYNLRKEDVIALPPDLANILIKRGAAEEVKATV
ncbi:MAG TPA: DNA replication complex GINS family protein [Thermoplasmatales archaeon]|nr:DNA replication complex GINS family protein [Thermoplasmatales archaeon]